MKVFLATLFGAIASFIVNIGIVMVGHLINPVVLDMSDPDAMLEAFRSMNTYDFIIPMIAHIFGVLAGLIVARAICKISVVPIFIVAGLHMLGVIVNLIQLPHPMWFAVIDVILPILIVIPFIRKVKTV